MYRLLAALLRLFMGVIYPGYQTFKLLNSSLGITQLPKYQKLLKFWLVMAVFTTIEFFSDSLLFWFPFYYEFKLVLLIYCTLPQFEGYTTIYEKLVLVKLKENEHEIDEQLDSFHETYQRALNSFYSDGQNFLLIVWQNVEHRVKNFLLQNSGLPTIDNASSKDDTVIKSEKSSKGTSSNLKADISSGSQPRTWFDEVASLINLGPSATEKVSSTDYSHKKIDGTSKPSSELNSTQSKLDSNSRPYLFRKERKYGPTKTGEETSTLSEPPAYSKLSSDTRTHPNSFPRPRVYADLQQGAIRRRNGN